MTTNVQRVNAPSRLDHLCDQRLKALNFAQPQYKIAKLISKIKGVAK